MSKSILDIPGIGQATFELLESNGIHTLEDLAAQTSERLVKIKGFQAFRAKKILQNAQSMLKTSEGSLSKSGGITEEFPEAEPGEKLKKRKKVKSKKIKEDKPKAEKKMKKKKDKKKAKKKGTKSKKSKKSSKKKKKS